MTNFKVGDVVERAGRASNIWLDFTAADAGPYVVTSTTAGGWVQINGYRGYDGYNTHPFEADKFKLVEQDDPLPPAPESVLYIGLQDYYRALRVRRASYHDAGGALNLHIGGGVLGDGKSCVLDPDAALQLAHDLTRMAMEIKRRERAQSGE